MKPFKVLITGAGTTTAILVFRGLRGGQLVTRHRGRYATELCVSLSSTQAQVGGVIVVLMCPLTGSMTNGHTESIREDIWHIDHVSTYSKRVGVVQQRGE